MSVSSPPLWPHLTIRFVLLTNFEHQLFNSHTQVDYKRVAHFFGQGATYDAIEGRFRKAKKDAHALAAEAAGRPEPKTRNDKPSTPRKKAANGMFQP
jgi:hypothetical protein